MTGQRGQLVVLAALALAVALVPMALAYLQLGYQNDVRASTVDDDVVRDVERTLETAVVGESADVPADYPWANRTGAVTVFRDRLRPTVDTLETARLDDGTAVSVSYHDSRASRWASTHCPSGPDRQFGPCRVDRGVVVQERAGRTHVLAVAVEVRVTPTDGDRQTVTVVTTR